MCIEFIGCSVSYTMWAGMTMNFACRWSLYIPILMFYLREKALLYMRGMQHQPFLLYIYIQKRKKEIGV